MPQMGSLTIAQVFAVSLRRFAFIAHWRLLREFSYARIVVPELVRSPPGLVGWRARICARTARIFSISGVISVVAPRAFFSLLFNSSMRRQRSLHRGR